MHNIENGIPLEDTLKQMEAMFKDISSWDENNTVTMTTGPYAPRFSWYKHDTHDPKVYGNTYIEAVNRKAEFLNRMTGREAYKCTPPGLHGRGLILDRADNGWRSDTDGVWNNLDEILTMVQTYTQRAYTDHRMPEWRNRLDLDLKLRCNL